MGENEKWPPMGISFWVHENVLELDSGCKNLWIYWNPLNCTLKNSDNYSMWTVSQYKKAGDGCIILWIY